MKGAIGGHALGGRACSAARVSAVGVLCLLATVALCLVLAPVSSASASSFTWSGRSTTTEDWSESQDWEGGAAPTGAVGTLTFPRLTSFACEDERRYHPCYYSKNNVGGLSAESVRIDDGEDYAIWGDELTLGGGGLSATPGAAASEPTGDVVEAPLHLSTSQTWSVEGRGDSEFAYSNLLLAGNLTGSASALTVGISEGAGLYLAENDTEVGPVKIEGADAGKAGVLNGFVELIEADLNTSDEQPVELSHVYLGGSGAIGPLRTNDAELAVGTSYYPAEAIEATSAKLDSASDVSFEVSHTGVVAAEDNSELTSHGAVELGSATIEVVVRPPKEREACPALVNGQTYTLVSTTGTLSGTFANVPEHGAEIPIRFANACTSTSQTLLVSYSESGGAQTVIGMVESGEKAPGVTKQPSGVEVVKGEEATFEAAASGLPAPTVQWQLSTDNGASWGDVTGETSDTLRVPATKTSENGDEYRAVFTNGAGKAETTAAILTVDAEPVAPEVIKTPSSVTLLEGEEATFEAAASGAPAPTVQWELSTNKGATWSLVEGATSDTLRMPDTRTSESGDEYRAVFTNGAGKAETVAATLTVNAVPEVTKDPASLEVLEGGEATFEAAASGVPAPTVQWELSANHGATWAPVGGAESDTLTISSAKTSESGDEYRAVFTNSAGKAETNVATLTVNVTAEVTKEPTDVTLLEGEEAAFEAAATGVPAPTVQWQISTNKGATWSPVNGATSDRLRIASAKTSESGDEYRAVFTNVAGKAETTAATLTVNAVPKVTKDPASLEVLEGGEATFEAAASGVPAPTVQWQISTDKGATWSPIAGAASDRLTISNVTVAVSGDEYRALFTNAVGEATSEPSATLTVESLASREAKEAKASQETKMHEEQMAAAVAKQRQEVEAAAKGGVLGVKEGAPAATLASTSLKVSASGTVKIKVSCPAGVSSCAGTVTLRTLSAVSVGVAGAPRAKASVLRLATGSFSIPGGSVETLTLHVSAKARVLLKRSHVLRVRVTIAAHDPGGGTHTGQEIATLRPSNNRHGKA